MLFKAENRSKALEFDFPSHTERIDIEKNGKFLAWKDVDFIINDGEECWFIEVKDPDHPRAIGKKTDKCPYCGSHRPNTSFIDEIKSGELIKNLVLKYRHTLIWRWAQDKKITSLNYVVLLSMKSIDAAYLLTLTDRLKAELPLAKANTWVKPIAKKCMIVNLEQWEKQFPNWKVTRSKK